MTKQQTIKFIKNKIIILKILLKVLESKEEFEDCVIIRDLLVIAPELTLVEFINFYSCLIDHIYAEKKYK